MTTYYRSADAIDAPNITGKPIPAQILGSPVVLAYSGGNSFPTWKPYRAARPDLVAKNWVVPVTLSCVAWGHCYDIEPGGGQVKNIGVFMHNARAVWKTQKVWGPQWLYTFASNAQAVLDEAQRLGYVRGRDFYLLSAHPGVSSSHVCGDGHCNFPKADGCQNVFAGSYDLSLVADYMLPKVAPPPAPQRASGIFNASLSYDHDHQKVTMRNAPGSAIRWGDVSERIDLKVSLEVGRDNPKRGLWQAQVIGRELP